ncbi:MAG: substrate-binding domain-containing protein [Clostridia bacterium]|nr:substrate-binding domain-containing protein [Clostridia bacterium]
MKELTATDIARALSISRATVMRVLRDSQSVSPEKREAVLLYIGENCPDADLTADGTAYDIVAAIPSVPSFFWNRAMEGVRDACRAHPELRVKLLRYSGRRNTEETLRIIGCVSRLQSRAAILVPVDAKAVSTALERLAAERKVLILDNAADFAGCACAYCSDAAGEGERAVELVRAFPLERKKLLILTAQNDGGCNSQLRLDSFYRRCRGCTDILPVAELGVSGTNALSPSILARQLARLEDSYNCVYISDGFFYQACAALRKVGRLRDVYVLGHERSKPVMTLFDEGMRGAYIEQDIYAQAYASVEAAVRLLNGKAPLEAPIPFRSGWYNYKPVV